MWSLAIPLEFTLEVALFNKSVLHETHRITTGYLDPLLAKLGLVDYSFSEEKPSKVKSVK